MINFVIIGFCIASLTLSGISMYFQYRIPNKYKRLRKRNQEVYEFRLWVLNNRHDVYHQLPDYDTMMKDKKPLTLQSYITS
jgi:hypothetical protein